MASLYCKLKIALAGSAALSKKELCSSSRSLLSGRERAQRCIGVARTSSNNRVLLDNPCEFQRVWDRQSG